jgi:hypothetical protein
MPRSSYNEPDYNERQAQLNKEYNQMDDGTFLPEPASAPIKKSDNWLTLVPAYGRDYHNADEVLKAWMLGKDFRIQDVGCKYNGAYIGKGDAPPDTVFKVRYNRLADFVLIMYAGGTWVMIGNLFNVRLFFLEDED